MRDQGPSGFCDICEAVAAVDNYRHRREDELNERRERWAAWVGSSRMRQETA